MESVLSHVNIWSVSTLPSEQVRRGKCIDTALGNLLSPERLDLSLNVMSGALRYVRRRVLHSLRLTYLNVTDCGLVLEDLEMILSLSQLVHHDISLNSGVGEMLGSLVSAVQDTKLSSLEILEMVRCDGTSTNEQNLSTFSTYFLY